jgi:quinol monooxygenase YgiN
VTIVGGTIVAEIIVAGTFEVDPSSRDEFLRNQEDNMRRSRAEPGCITYVFSADPIEPGRVCLFERWESKAALGAHLAGQRAAGPAPAGVAVLSVEAQQYEISAVGPIGS